MLKTRLLKIRLRIFFQVVAIALSGAGPILIIGGALMVISQRNTSLIQTDFLYRAQARAEVLKMRTAAGCQMLIDRPDIYHELVRLSETAASAFNQAVSTGPALESERIVLDPMPSYRPAGYYGYMEPVWRECQTTGYYFIRH